MINAYLSVFVSAFVAATLLPALSELALSALVVQGYDPLALWLAASTGNTLGACVNWILGRYLRTFENRRWFPFNSSDVARAEQTFNRFGVWSLLFAWLPIVGDPLTFIAGALRTRFWLFCLLVGAGKSARYAVVIAIALSVNG